MSFKETSIQSQFNLNADNSNSDKVYVFEDFRLDVPRLMLYREGEPTLLAPKVVETLLALVERSGEIVGKEELMNRLWADSFVEEANLTQNIYLLRKTLGKGTDGCDLIETFRRRGYRFNGHLKETAVNETQLNEELPNKPDGIIGESSIKDNLFLERQSFNRRLGAGVAVLALLLTAVYGLSSFLNPKARDLNPTKISDGKSSNLGITRLMPDLDVNSPVISPDGQYLAYYVTSKGIWLKELSTGKAVQLVGPSSKGDKAIQFSSDGKYLYFLDVVKSTVNRVATTGGIVQEILKNVAASFAVSPDGRQLAFVREKGLVVANIDGSSERIIAERDGAESWFATWSSQIAWSPDGRKIALCAGHLEKNQKRPEIVEISIVEGLEHTIPTLNLIEVTNLVWQPDGDGLFLTARENESSPLQIWYLKYPGGAPQKISNDLNNYGSLSMTGDAASLVAEQMRGKSSIWVMPPGDSTSALQLSSSDGSYEGASGIVFTPDRKIVYTSTRSGNVDLWRMNADGSDRRQLTVNLGSWNGRQNVSADGRFIVFRITNSGVSQLWRIDANGENPKKITDEDGDEDYPSISPDGKWVYFSLTKDKLSSIRRVPIDGGETERVSGNFLATTPVVSPDGKLILYQHAEVSAPNSWQVALMNVKTAEPIKKFGILAHRGILRWSADSKSFFYLQKDSPNLWQQPLDEKPPTQVTQFELEKIWNFAISPDHQLLAAVRGNVNSEAVLIKRF